MRAWCHTVLITGHPLSYIYMTAIGLQNQEDASAVRLCVDATLPIKQEGCGGRFGGWGSLFSCLRSCEDGDQAQTLT